MFRIFAVFARASVFRFATSSGMFLMSCIVPVWWSINSKAESAGVKVGILAVMVCPSEYGFVSRARCQRASIVMR
jgi:hypothetical protein